MKITLKQARIGAGLTQKEVSKALGICTPTYALYEEHPGKMKVELLWKFSELVKVDIKDLQAYNSPQ